MLDVSTRVPYGVYMTNIYLFMLDHPTVIVAFVAVLAVGAVAVEVEYRHGLCATGPRQPRGDEVVAYFK